MIETNIPCSLLITTVSGQPTGAVATKYTSPFRQSTSGRNVHVIRAFHLSRSDSSEAVPTFLFFYSLATLVSSTLTCNVLRSLYGRLEAGLLSLQSNALLLVSCYFLRCTEVANLPCVFQSRVPACRLENSQKRLQNESAAGEDK